MRFRHLAVLAATAAGAGLVLLGPAAEAAPKAPVYPPAAPTLSVSATVVTAGQTVTVTGSGWQALSTVTATWTGTGARGMAHASFPFGTRGLVADAAGGVTTTITFQSAGDHVITLSGNSASGAPASVSATVTVQAAAGSGTELSHTGFPVMSYLLAALGLLLLGVLVIFLVRRRRAAHAAAAAATQPPAQPQPLQPTH